MTGRLQDRVAVVSGGASGSGLATAQTFADEGALVIIADIDDEAAQQEAEQIVTSGGWATWEHVDIADETSVVDLADRLRRRVEEIDVLYNSAAITDPRHQSDDGPPGDLPLPVWQGTLSVDLTGTMLMCRQLLPLLRRPGGAIVNVTSNAGLLGNDTLTSYGVAKSGLHQLTRQIATSYGHLGIRCNSLSPGSIASPSFLANVSPDVAERMLDNCLTPRLGTVGDVAAAAVFLCSDASAFITGEILRVDGGTLAPAVSW